MTNPQKRKGDRWERTVAKYLGEHGIVVERARAGQTGDRGDLAGDELIAYECRDRHRLSFSATADDANRHAAAAAKPIGVAIIKRPQRPTGDALVVMSLTDFAYLRNEIN